MPMTAAVVQLMTSWVESSCETLSILLNQKVEHQQPTTEMVGAEALQKTAWEGLAYPVVLVAPMEGQFHILIENSDLGKLVSLLVGGDPETIAHSPGEMHLGVMMEALQQLVGGLKTILGGLAERDVKLTLAKPQGGLPIEGNQQLSISYVLNTEEQPNILLTLLLPTELAERFASLNASATSAPAEAAPARSSVTPTGEDEDPQEEEDLAFQAILEKENSQVDFLMDVPLRLQVVLGRSSVAVQELIGLGEGSVVELDQVAGEPVELFVHGRLIAYGEVTVVGDKFGVKVTELASRDAHPSA